MNRATAVPGLNRDDAYALDIGLPAFVEQRRIAAKIDSLSAKSKRARDQLDHIPRLVEKYKQAILAAMFGGIEDDAEEKTLDQLAVHITSGSRDWSQYYGRGDSVFVLAGNVKPMAFDPEPKQYVDPPLQGAEAKRTLIEAGDLLVTIVGANTGDVCYVPAAVRNHFVCQSVALVRLREPERASPDSGWAGASTDFEILRALWWPFCCWVWPALPPKPHSRRHRQIRVPRRKRALFRLLKLPPSRSPAGPKINIAEITARANRDVGVNIETAINGWQHELDRLGSALQKPRLRYSELNDLRDELQRVRAGIEDFWKRLEPPLAAAKDQVALLGAAPAAGQPPEPELISPR